MSENVWLAIIAALPTIIAAIGVAYSRAAHNSSKSTANDMATMRSDIEGQQVQRDADAAQAKADMHHE